MRAAKPLGDRSSIAEFAFDRLLALLGDLADMAALAGERPQRMRSRNDFFAATAATDNPTRVAPSRKSGQSDDVPDSIFLSSVVNESRTARGADFL
jgi:hypothetical protein